MTPYETIMAAFLSCYVQTANTSYPIHDAMIYRYAMYLPKPVTTIAVRKMTAKPVGTVKITRRDARRTIRAKRR